MGQVRAAVIISPNTPVEVREFDVPELELNSALLQVEFSEVCGTDVHLQQGRLRDVPYPLIPGHVSVGILSKIRGRLKDVDDLRLREGDRVTFLDVHQTCHRCWYCLVAKATTRCPHRKVYGITYGAKDGLAGGWAEQVYLKPETRILPLGDLEPRTFIAGGCSLPTALHAVDLAEIRVADSVLVLGSGPVGISAISFARMSGALRVFCIGAPEVRLAAARRAGADEAFDFTSADEETRFDWIRSRTGGRGVDVTIEATGAPEAVVQAMKFTRDAGRVVVVGQYTDHGEVRLNPHSEINRKHLEIKGCWGCDFSHFHRGMQVIADPDKGACWRRLDLESFSLERAQKALDAVSAGDVVKAIIEPGLSEVPRLRSDHSQPRNV